MELELLGARYRIGRELGRGGMGRVFVAHDLKLGRDVAIKVLAPGHHDPLDVQRFEQEARAAGALEHPNVIAVHDVGTDGGSPYIISELLQGTTLRDALRNGPLPLETALDYARQLAHGLSAAHAKGVIHRDIKPENLFITESSVLKILDFGIAKLAAQHAAAADGRTTPATQTGAIVGTVGYMAPEQVRGNKVDHRADLFAFGAVLFEMLSGQRAFSRASRVETAYAVLNDEPPPLPRGVPRAVQRIVRACLAKSPEARCQSARDLEIAIDAVVPRRVAPRRKGPLLLLAALGIAAGLLGASPRLRSWLSRTASASRPAVKQLAVLPFRAVGGGPEADAFAAGLAEMLNNRLQQLEQFQGALRVVSANEVVRERVATARDARRAFGATLALTGTVRWSQDQLALTSELVDTGTQLVLAARDLQLARKDVPELRARLLERVADMLDLELNPGGRPLIRGEPLPAPGAYEFYLQGRGYLQRYDRDNNVQSAIAVFRNALERDPRYAPAWAGLAEALLRRFDLLKDPKLIDEARASDRRALELDDHLATAHETMGLLHSMAGEYEPAIVSFERALEVEPGNVDALGGLARAYAAAGRPRDGELTFKRAILLRPNYWAAYRDLGAFYNQQGRIGEAVAPLRHVIELTPDNYVGYANLAGVQMRLGHLEEATALLERSLALNRTSQAYSNLGTVHYFQKRYRDAAEMFLRAVELDPSDDRTWGNLADASRFVPERASDAVRTYREAAAHAEEHLALNPRDADLRSRLAMYRAASGENEAALREIDQALRISPQDGLVLFRAALVFEQSGKRERALDAVGRAIERGFSREEIEKAPPLDGLRQDPRFVSLNRR